MRELINNAPDVKLPLAGYAALAPGKLYPSSALTPGTVLSTSDTIDKVNPLTISVASNSKGGGGGSKVVLNGIGNSASTVQTDIQACGPTVIHVIDQILLPFSWNEGATDAISGTQVNRATKPAYTLSSSSSGTDNGTGSTSTSG